jgi:hypothetical protein
MKRIVILKIAVFRIGTGFFSNGPYFEHRAPFLTIFSGRTIRPKKMAGDVLGHRPTTGNFLEKIGDLSTHTICRIGVD